MTWSASGSSQAFDGTCGSGSFFTVSITTYAIGDQIIITTGASGSPSVYAGGVVAIDCSGGVSGGITADYVFGTNNQSGIWRGVVTAVGTFSLNVHLTATGGGSPFASLIVQSFTFAGTPIQETTGDVGSGGGTTGNFPSLSPLAANELYLGGGQMGSTPFTTSSTGYVLATHQPAGGVAVCMIYYLNASNPNVYAPNWTQTNGGGYNLLAELLTAGSTGNNIVMII